MKHPIRSLLLSPLVFISSVLLHAEMPVLQSHPAHSFCESHYVGQVDYVSLGLKIPGQDGESVAQPRLYDTLRVKLWTANETFSGITKEEKPQSTIWNRGVYGIRVDMAKDLFAPAYLNLFLLSYSNPDKFMSYIENRHSFLPQLGQVVDSQVMLQSYTDLADVPVKEDEELYSMYAMTLQVWEDGDDQGLTDALSGFPGILQTPFLSWKNSEIKAKLYLYFINKANQTKFMIVDLYQLEDCILLK